MEVLLRIIVIELLIIILLLLIRKGPKKWQENAKTWAKNMQKTDVQVLKWQPRDENKVFTDTLEYITGTKKEKK